MSNHPTSVPREEDLVKMITKVRNMAEPYMKKGVDEDWQEFIAETDTLYLSVLKFGNSRELEGRIDELDNKLPGAMGYRNITPIIASNISKRIDELESQKGSMNE